MAPGTKPTFDCIVFSGGGAKGAYGAGAAKALWEYRALKSVNTSVCLIGASAGALNAAILAMYDVDKLIRLWRFKAQSGILGVRVKSARFQGLLKLAKRIFSSAEPYAVYPNRSLRRLLEEETDFTRLQGKHLIVAATNSSKSTLRAFYHSDLMHAFKCDDEKLPTKHQRLGYMEQLTSENLVPALLASSAIPLIFPPVRIDDDWHIDGGVGNNTPTRQAAYFLRYLKESNLGEAGDVYCIRLEPPRLQDEDLAQAGALEVAERAFSIYHDLHTTPIVKSWDRINREVGEQQEKLEAFLSWCEANVADADLRKRLQAEVESLFKLPGATQRLDRPLIVVEPSSQLGKTLEFDRKIVEGNIRIGFIDMLKALRAADKIDETEESRLQKASLFPAEA